MKAAIRLSAGVLIALAVGAVIWLASDRAPLGAISSLLAGGGAVLAAVLVNRHPAAAFGVLLLLASISRPTIELPLGSMRVEQPAIAAVTVALLATRWSGVWSAVRAAAPIVIAFAAYLLVLAVSSVLVAPEPMGSLRIVVWTAVSMAGGMAAYVLLRTAPLTSGPWFRLAGLSAAVAGIALGIVFLVAGPDLGELQAGRKVHAYFWEANLYASFLALTVPFAIEGVRARPTVLRAAVALMILVAFALGLTRGAYLGLGVGLAAYFGILAVRRVRLRSLLAPAGVALVGLLLGVVATAVLLPTVRPPVVRPAVSATPRPSVVATPRPSVVATPRPTPRPTPPPTPPDNDTLAFRLERVPVALEDLATSPLIGMGADSFGQRHLDPTQRNSPDHLAIMAVAAVYEAGVLGAAALAIGFVLVLLGLFRATGRAGGAAAAFAAACLASLTSLLVAYQATNAVHFAVTWLLVGACLAALRPGGDSQRTAA